MLYYLAIAGYVYKFSTMSPNLWNGNLLNCGTTYIGTFISPLSWSHDIPTHCSEIGRMLGFYTKDFCADTKPLNLPSLSLDGEKF